MEVVAAELPKKRRHRPTAQCRALEASYDRATWRAVGGMSVRISVER
jgi:hypothetical protein